MITVESQDLLSVSLAKWPGLLVSGPSISADDAAEILLRTDGGPLVYSPCCNDLAWDRAVNEALGLAPGDYSASSEVRLEQGRARERTRNSLGWLDLSYLSNHQIASSWIGGPHGWLNWSGDVGCNSFNIGKWPSVEDVLGDWSSIAEAFPQLILTGQLLSAEIGEEGSSPIVEFLISGGYVTLRQPFAKLEFSSERDFEALMTQRMLNPHGERGCTIDQVQRALEVVRLRAEKQNG